MTPSFLRRREWDVVTHTCNFSTCEAEAEDLEFKASQGYIVRHCLKKEKKKNQNKTKKKKKRREFCASENGSGEQFGPVSFSVVSWSSRLSGCVEDCCHIIDLSVAARFIYLFKKQMKSHMYTNYP
jgi:hypothetical protein